MDTKTFAEKIKAKYPQYKNVDDATLVQKIVTKYPVYQSQITDLPKQKSKGFTAEDAKGDVIEAGKGIVEAGKSRLGKIGESISALGDRFKDVKQNIAEGDILGTAKSIFTGKGQGIKDTAFQVAGQAAGFASDTIGEATMGAGKLALPQSAEDTVAEKVQSTVAPIAQSDAVQGLMTRFEALKETNPKLARDIDAALGFGALGLEVAGAGIGGKAAKVAGKTVAEAGEQGLKQGVKITKDGASKSGDIALRLISPDLDDTTKTILKETPTARFDEAKRIAQEAAKDIRNPSSFEVVGERIADATKQIDRQVKALSSQKKTIIGKAKTGLQDFSKETGNTILEINRALPNSPIGKRFIDRLKKVKSKIDADNAIDELQDSLYKGNRDLTIPSGSSEDKILRSLLGKYNTSLKNTLPTSYANLNAQISNRLKVLRDLNKALSDVVEGVPVRGASLVKQFFSPSGTRAKQLFEYIKKTTGIDVAQDAVVAKFMAETFGDVRAKSLLEGIPTSTSGVINKVIDFVADKSGAVKGLQSLSRKGSIKKARRLTKP